MPDPSVLQIQFDENGDINAEQEQALHRALADSAATDLLVFSHGWNNSQTQANGLYRRFFGMVANLLAQRGKPGRTVAYLGVYWPSLRWSDEPIPDFDSTGVVDLGAGSGGAAGGFAPAPEFPPPPPPDTELAGLIRDSFPDAVRGDVDELLTLIQSRPDDRDTLLRARQLVQSIAAAVPPDGDGEQADRPPFAAESDPDAQLFADFTAALEELNVVTGGQGGAAGFGDAVRRLWHGAQEAARGLTYWQMKNRAGVVGDKGVGPLLARLRQQRPDLGIHLIGHSFGARLASYALKNAPPAAVRSVTLLQGAFSHFAFAAQLPFDAGRSGALTTQQDKVSGPVTACYSRFDSAVGTMYPLASLLKGDDASAAGDAMYRWGGIGHDGHQRGVPEVTLLDVGSPYDFAGAKLVNIDAQRVVRNGRPPSGAHSDIFHEQLAWVVLSGGGLVG